MLRRRAAACGLSTVAATEQCPAHNPPGSYDGPPRCLPQSDPYQPSWHLHAYGRAVNPPGHAHLRPRHRKQCNIGTLPAPSYTHSCAVPSRLTLQHVTAGCRCAPAAATCSLRRCRTSNKYDSHTLLSDVSVRCGKAPWLCQTHLQKPALHSPCPLHWLTHVCSSGWSHSGPHSPSSLRGPGLRARIAQAHAAPHAVSPL